MIGRAQEQLVPVRVYQGDERLMVAMPLPGLEPEDISVTVVGSKLVVRGEYRGPHQEDRHPLVAEWAVGPYYRELDLPQPVNGALANATYGNGVLVLVLPKLAAGQQGTDADFQLEVITATRGERVGHAGRDLHETTTTEHRQRVEETARRASH